MQSSISVATDYIMTYYARLCTCRHVLYVHYLHPREHV